VTRDNDDDDDDDRLKKWRPYRKNIGWVYYKRQIYVEHHT